MPVFAHLEGICHVYVDKARRARHGEDDRAQRQDAAHRRLRRGRDAAGRSRGRGDASQAAGRRCCSMPAARCAATTATQAVDARVKPASEEDWSTEYLDAIIAAKVVDGVDGAIAHIERYGSHHTDAIVTEDKAAAEKFLQRGRFRDRAAQRLDPVRRRRRVRLRRRDRHRHRPLACARPGRRRAAHQLQVSRARHAGRSGRDSRVRRQCRPQPSSLPPHAPGMRIGLFGGTFDPPHEAHLAACLLAMKRLGLDRVWWLVTPGNPLKDTRGLAPLDEAHRGGTRAGAPSAHRRHRPRSRHRHALHLRHPRAICARRCPGVRFVWIMGADNLRSFHRWQNWRGIAALVPIAVVDRLGPSLYAAGGRRRRRRSRAAAFPKRRRRSLPDRKPPAWVYLHGLKSPLSSTALRACDGGHKTDAKAPQYGDAEQREVETVNRPCLS